jgi:rSAM/selenodomain-associated transferase 1
MISPVPSHACLLVFAKAPVPGSAKTRLIPLLGAEGAARLQARLTRRALNTALTAAIGRVELCCAPDAAHPFFAALGAELGVSLYSQCGGDLGDKMWQGAKLALAKARYALLLGTDCPRLTPRHLQEALAQLRGGKEATLIPAEDGGYVLLGLARPEPELFRGIEWGSARVLAQTRERLERLGWPYAEQEALPDLDLPQDWLNLRQSHPLLWLELNSEETRP